MAPGDDTGEGTGKNTGPHPITPPFNWGLGSAPDPVAPPAPVAPPEPVALPVPVAPPAPPAPPALIPSAPPESAPFYGSPMAERRPEPYFTSDSDKDADPASPIDALFGETQFKEYEGEPLVGPIPAALNPFASAGAGAARAIDPASAHPSETPTAAPPLSLSAQFSRSQKVPFWVAGGVIALLVCAVLFALGTRISAAPAPVAATKSATPKVSPSPTPTSAPSGQAAAGVRLWSALRGGECIDPYTNPFELKFTVVDCAAPHSAQMVFRSTFPGEATVAYPGLDALQAQINLLCSAPRVIDLATAGAYSDIQFQASYAAAAEEWTKGQHDYFCFVNRSGGQPITGSVAGTPAK